MVDDTPGGDPTPVTTAPTSGPPPVGPPATRDSPTIVTFVASWCRNCQAELAAFGTRSARSSGRVAVVGVDPNYTDPDLAGPLIGAARAHYPVGVDSDASDPTSYLLNGLPVACFLDARGRVVHVALGTQSPSAPDRRVSTLTGKAVSS